MFPTYRKALALLVLMTATALPGAVAAHDHRNDHEQATKALAAGEVLPLRTVLRRVERDFPGRVMGVEFERQYDVWVYKIKILQRGGLLLKLKVDARTAQVIDIKKRSVRHRGKTDAYPGGRR
ncbi:MAG: peptidase [Burkholderiaceae bacterium]|nr:peptidase [Burkholderiaceae bacterium]